MIDLRLLIGRLRETARLMVGQPSYAAYRRHMAERHPDRPAMSEAEFYHDRLQARYGGKGAGRCC